MSVLTAYCIKRSRIRPQLESLAFTVPHASWIAPAVIRKKRPRRDAVVSIWSKLEKLVSCRFPPLILHFGVLTYNCIQSIDCERLTPSSIHCLVLICCDFHCHSFSRPFTVVLGISGNTFSRTLNTSTERPLCPSWLDSHAM